jgi:hypothetical protein
MKGIEEAEAGLLEALQEGREVPPRDLRQQVLEDSKTEEESLEAGQVSLAFWRLLDRGEIELTDDLKIRLATPLPA